MFIALNKPTVLNNQVTKSCSMICESLHSEIKYFIGKGEDWIFINKKRPKKGFYHLNTSKHSKKILLNIQSKS